MKKILVIGSRPRLDEFQQLDLQSAEIDFLDQFYLDLDQIEVPFQELETPEDDYFIENIQVPAYDVVFDLNLDENAENLERYADNPNQVVIGCAVKQSLGQMVYDSDLALECKLFGMNSLPSFIQRDRLECSLYHENDLPLLDGLLTELGLQYEVVDDRIGMVTPRIVCMIINEACFVLKEGTAGVEAVDQAMRLGTNYPNGPFQWAEKIGISNVYEVLEALKEDTGEEKYKMAPLLKQYYFRGKGFYEKG